jgi:50S ribosomal protein L16 3-hydroxylase
MIFSTRPHYIRRRGTPLLPDWLAPDDLRWFCDQHLQKAPYARPGAAAASVPLFGWGTLDRVLKSDLPIDVLTVTGGRVVDVPVPRTASDVSRLLESGVSVVVRAAEMHDPGLRELAASFEHALPGEVHVQLYVTPGGTNSYGWHYDFEDVFIVQTAGVKDYYFRANTVARNAVLGDVLDFSRAREEVSPLFSARLVTGDWLYLPATWWHLVKCIEDSLSISVGVMPPSAFDRAKRLPAGWKGRGYAGSGWD